MKKFFERIKKWFNEFIEDDNLKPYYTLKLKTVEDLLLLSSGDYLDIVIKNKHGNERKFNGLVKEHNLHDKKILIFNLQEKKNYYLIYSKKPYELKLSKTILSGQYWTISKLLPNTQLYTNHFDIM